SLCAPRRPPWNPCPTARPGLMTASNAPSMSVARNLIRTSPVTLACVTDRNARTAASLRLWTDWGDSRESCPQVQQLYEDVAAPEGRRIPLFGLVPALLRLELDALEDHRVLGQFGRPGRELVRGHDYGQHVGV